MPAKEALLNGRRARQVATKMLFKTRSKGRNRLLREKQQALCLRKTFC